MQLALSCMVNQPRLNGKAPIGEMAKEVTVNIAAGKMLIFSWSRPSTLTVFFLFLAATFYVCIGNRKQQP